MSKPFKDTPILEGKDAEKFLDNLAMSLSHQPTEEEKAEKERERIEMKASFDFFSSISDGIL